MGDANEDRAKAQALPDGDAIGMLLEQHARIRDLFDQVKSATGEEKKDAFDALRALLAVHETGEELVLRPVTEKIAGERVALARNEEEKEANVVLAKLEKMSVEDADFDVQLAAFEQAVVEHAEAEEAEEFPQVISGCDEAERRRMGTKLKAAAALGPTHPHPSVAGNRTAQLMTGPFASMIDRVRDAIAAVG
ncbi:hemerythrin domain-containing protein [Nocardioides sp. BP30]|uniref:hemerythrin domain-containing protein n=1 Tax=Nocardioides sp. BP30 TaxID=3036374 RepID=UPI002469989A|nr:hemerythrin domain-containing protein [Nocardioides sp. BP30]WGL53015.1 hemerythrin domain-containing protein [Nocardioides sp. BP30]